MWDDHSIQQLTWKSWDYSFLIEIEFRFFCKIPEFVKHHADYHLQAFSWEYHIVVNELINMKIHKTISRSSVDIKIKIFLSNLKLGFQTNWWLKFWVTHSSMNMMMSLLHMNSIIKKLEQLHEILSLISLHVHSLKHWMWILIC